MCFATQKALTYRTNMMQTSDMQYQNLFSNAKGNTTFPQIVVIRL